jgi:outer membrane protein assembly factor BamA
MMQPGQLYNAEDGRKALRDVFALGLFDNVQIFPKPSQKDESKVCFCTAQCCPLI